MFVAVYIYIYIYYIYIYIYILYIYIYTLHSTSSSNFMSISNLCFLFLRIYFFHHFLESRNTSIHFYFPQIHFLCNILACSKLNLRASSGIFFYYWFMNLLIIDEHIWIRIIRLKQNFDCWTHLNKRNQSRAKFCICLCCIHLIFPSSPLWLTFQFYEKVSLK